MSGDGNLDVYDGPALARLPCATCGVETLHRGVCCVHCGGRFAPRPATVGRKRDWTINPRKRRGKEKAPAVGTGAPAVNRQQLSR